MRFDKVLLILNVQLKPESLQQYLPCSANIIGQTLAGLADEYEKENKTFWWDVGVYIYSRDLHIKLWRDNYYMR